MAAPPPLTDRYGRPYVDPFRIRTPDAPPGTAFTGRTAEEATALYKSEGLRVLADRPAPGTTNTQFTAAIEHLRATGRGEEADKMLREAQQGHAQVKQDARAAEREFFRIANEVDKIQYFTLPNGRQIPNVRGPQEDVRRAEQKTAIYDQSARERRGRRTTLQGSRGGGGGTGGGGVTGLSSSSFRKTLLGG